MLQPQADNFLNVLGREKKKIMFHSWFNLNWQLRSLAQALV